MDSTGKSQPQYSPSGNQNYSSLQTLKIIVSPVELLPEEQSRESIPTQPSAASQGRCKEHLHPKQQSFIQVKELHSPRSFLKEKIVSTVIQGENKEMESEEVKTAPIEGNKCKPSHFFLRACTVKKALLSFFREYSAEE